MNKQQVIDSLKLIRHVEGGWFQETYRSEMEVATADREGGKRAVLTSIYYMLTGDCPTDHFHMNKSPILHYYQLGSPLTYYVLYPDGNLERHVLGPDVANGQTMQLLVPGGTWKAAVLEQGEFGLIGESVAPGFDYRDMTLGTKSELKEKYPQHWDKISKYVKE